MSDRSMAGARIRETRMRKGIRQSELAQRVGISASYMNLIEHNRRRIAGKTLLKLAEALDVEPTVLSEGAEAALIAGLREAASRREGQGAELDRAEEFASRFPGWARVLANFARDKETLEREVQILSDRLTHDPHLATTLHEVISSVTAIRSTASILAETRELEPEWQTRFHRNIDEDSRRLAEGAETLKRYLEAAPDTGAEIRSPQDELHAFFTDHGFRFPELEDENADDAGIDTLVAESRNLNSGAACALARDALREYHADAMRLPLRPVLDAIARHGLAPDRLADMFGVDLACVFRRLAVLPEKQVGPVGLVICDGSGTLGFRKPIAGFDVPSAASACTLWPLFQVMGQPHTPLDIRLLQAGRGREVVRAMAVAGVDAPARLNRPALIRAHMLIVPDAAGPADARPRDVGVSCRICPLPECPARREPSITAEDF